MRYINKVTKQIVNVVDRYIEYGKESNTCFVVYTKILTSLEDPKNNKRQVKYRKPENVFIQFYVPENLYKREH